MADRGAGCWESRLSGSERGWSATLDMDEILWHRRETRRKNGEHEHHPVSRGVSSLLEYHAANQPKKQRIAKNDPQETFASLAALVVVCHMAAIRRPGRETVVDQAEGEALV